MRNKNKSPLWQPWPNSGLAFRCCTTTMIKFCWSTNTTTFILTWPHFLLSPVKISCYTISTSTNLQLWLASTAHDVGILVFLLYYHFQGSPALSWFPNSQHDIHARHFSQQEPTHCHHSRWQIAMPQWRLTEQPCQFFHSFFTTHDPLLKHSWCAFSNDRLTLLSGSNMSWCLSIA